MPVAHGKLFAGVDHLALVAHLPAPIGLVGGIADSHIAGRFHAVRDLAGVPALSQPIGKAAAGTGRDLLQRHCLRIAQCVQGISDLGILGGAVGGYDVEKRRCLRRWCLWVEARDV